MRLFTKEQSDLLCRNGLPDNHGGDWQPVVKLVLSGTGCTWLLNEIVRRNNALYGFGLTDYGMGHVLDGFINLSVLELASDPMQIHYVQPAPHFVPRHGLSVYRAAARMHSGITDDTGHLRQALDCLQAHERQTLHSAQEQRTAMQF